MLQFTSVTFCEAKFREFLDTVRPLSCKSLFSIVSFPNIVMQSVGILYVIYCFWNNVLLTVLKSSLKASYTALR